MAPLTWREVSQPDFGSTFKGYANANAALNEGFASIGAALKNFTEARANVADRNILNRALGIQDPEALTRALADGSITGGDSRYAHTDTLKSLSDILNNTIRNAKTQEDLKEAVWKQKNLETDYGLRDLANRYQDIATTQGQAKADEFLAGEGAPLRNLSRDTFNNLITGATASSVGATNLREGQKDIALRKEATKLLDPVLKSFTNDPMAAQAFVDRPDIDPLVRPYLVQMLRANGHTIDPVPEIPYNGATSRNTPIGPIVSTGAGTGMPVVSGTPTQPAGFGYPTAAVTASGGHPATAAIAAATTGPSGLPGVNPNAGVPPQNAGGVPTNIGGVGLPGDGAPELTQANYNRVLELPNGTPKPEKDISTMNGKEWINYGEKIRQASGDLNSSAHGAYMIVNDTFKRFAPSVIGANWENVTITPEIQDKMGEAIFKDAVANGTPLEKVWTSLTPAMAQRVVQMPWDDAKKVIAAGESGNGFGNGGASLTSVYDRRNAAATNAIEHNLDIQGNLARMSSNPVVKNFLATASSDMDSQTAAEWGKRNIPQLANVPVVNIKEGIDKANAYMGDKANSAQALLAWTWSQQPVTKGWLGTPWRYAGRAYDYLMGNNPGDVPTTALGNGQAVNPKTMFAYLDQFMAPGTAQKAVATEEARGNAQNIADAANDIALAQQKVASIAPHMNPKYPWEYAKWEPAFKEAQALLAEKQAALRELQDKRSTSTRSPKKDEPKNKATEILKTAVGSVGTLDQQKAGWIGSTSTITPELAAKMADAKAKGAISVGTNGYIGKDRQFHPFS